MFPLYLSYQVEKSLEKVVICQLPKLWGSFETDTSVHSQHWAGSILRNVYSIVRQGVKLSWGLCIWVIVYLYCDFILFRTIIM